MSEIGKILSNILLKMFPQTLPEYQTEERKEFETVGRTLRGIKGKKDKIAMIKEYIREILETDASFSIAQVQTHLSVNLFSLELFYLFNRFDYFLNFQN